MIRVLNIHNLLSLVLVLSFMAACSRDDQALPADNGNEDINLHLSVRSSTVDPDYNIASLRMMVFNVKDKSLLLNSDFNPVDVYDPASRNYILSGKLRGISAIRVFIIANERPEWRLSKGITYAGLLELKANYYDAAGGNSDVQAPFLMLAGGDEDIPTPPDTKIEKQLYLVRNIVKVTLKLGQEILVPGSGNVPLTFKKVYIDRTPKSGYLCPGQNYAPAGGYTQTAVYDFVADDFVVGENISTLKEDLVFYIPEHLLTDKSNYTRLLITAMRNSGGSNNVVYEIPLGNGVNKLYDAVSPVPFADLTATDLSALRNTHFIIDTRVGQVELETHVKVKDWIIEDIEGEIYVPYLNISSLKENVTLTYTPIVGNAGNYTITTEPSPLVFYMWTNLPKEKLQLDPFVTVNTKVYSLSDLFDYTWVVADQSGGSLPGGAAPSSGKLELRFKHTASFTHTVNTDYTFKVSAGNLNRTFQLHVLNIIK